MNFSCDRNLLLNNLNIVSKAVNNKSTNPILECILITVYENGFKLTTNNLELGIETSLIEANIIEKGIIAVEAKIFLEIIRKINGDNVSIKKNESNVVISSGFSKFKIAVFEGDDFPLLPSVKKNDNYVLYQSDLKNMIKQTIFSIAQDDTKPILKGELIEIFDNTINIVSIDGYRISYKKSILLNKNPNVSVVVPGKTLNEVSKILSNEFDKEVNIYISDKHILFDLGDSIVVSRLLEGEYINYKQIFFDDFKTKILINRLNLISSLERTLLISRDTKKMPVKLNIFDDKIIIDSYTKIGTAHEEISIECHGDNLEIAFNPKYLIDALKVIEDEIVVMKFTSSLFPCIITPIEGDFYKYLILPLRS